MNNFDGQGSFPLEAYSPEASPVKTSACGAMPEIHGDGQTASTLRGASGGSSRDYVATTAVRRLTPTECERLQGFPDGWTEGQNDSARYRQMGNAVAVPVVEWIMKRLVEALA